MFDPARIRAICFDFGGTLDADGVAWRQRFYPLYRRHGVDVRRPKFDRAFYAADDALTAEGDPELSYRAVVHEQVRRVLHGLGVGDRSTAEGIAGDFLRDSLAHLDRNRPVLARLAQTRRLALVSNNYGNLRRICEDTGLAPLFVAVVDSRAVGFTKPDPRIFRAALEPLGIPADEAVMVGDSLPRDVAGARAVGMAAVLLSPAPAGAAAAEGADRTIGTLPELLGLFDEAG